MLGTFVKRAAWLLLIGSVVVAVLRGAPDDPRQWWAWLSGQSSAVEQQVKSTVNDTVMPALGQGDLPEVTPSGSAP